VHSDSVNIFPEPILSLPQKLCTPAVKFKIYGGKSSLG
jgi:hypothetical protein